MRRKPEATHNRRAAAAATAAVIAGLGLAPAWGQDPPPVTIEVGRCVDLQSPEERLSCFEREVEAAQRRTPAAEPPAAPASAEPVRPAAAPPPPTVDERRAARSAERAAEQRRRDQPAAPEITARVTELRETLPNAYLITLDNGQVWRQMRPKWYALRPGHEVRLRSTHWGGAYRLEAANLSGYIQVERVR